MTFELKVQRALLALLLGAHRHPPPLPGREQPMRRQPAMGVTLMAGSGRHTDDWAGRSVRSLRQQYASVFNIPSDSVPTINGQSASEDSLLSDGDELVFAKPTGSKG